VPQDEEQQHQHQQHQQKRSGFYDARETDAWACGVVLYVIVVRRLPFGEGDNAGPGGQGRIGGDGAPGHGHGRGSTVERRQWLMKIARGEYDWPESTCTTSSSSSTGNEEEEDELVGPQLIHSEGVKRIVSKLMVRDPRKRARIMDLWEDEWMWGPGGGLAVGMTEVEWREHERERAYSSSSGGGGGGGSGGMGLGIDFGESGPPVEFMNQGSVEEDGMEGGEQVIIDEKFLDEGMGDAEEVGEAGEEIEGEGEGEEVCEEVVDGEEGWLFDHEGIGSVARQELV
jgi:hypothetical protein